MLVKLRFNVTITTLKISIGCELREAISCSAQSQEIQLNFLHIRKLNLKTRQKNFKKIYFVPPLFP